MGVDIAIKKTVIPGFGLSFGVTVAYLSILVLMPFLALAMKTMEMSWEDFVAATTSERVIAAYKLTFGASAIAAILCALFGTIIAWVLVRYSFPLKNVLDAIIDIPFALPTAVAGIALTTIYSSSGSLGRILGDYGISIAFTPAGIVLALTFIGLPFVVRAVEPVLKDFDHEVEEAASSLGANRLQTFTKIILPNIFPAILAGFAMSFARGLGEYGSVIFIAGNLPMISEIVPLVIVLKLEQYDIHGATAIASVMLIASFILLFMINTIQNISRSRHGKKN